MNQLSASSRKAALLRLMVRPKEGEQFTDSLFFELVSLKGKEAVTFDDLRENIRRIYDMNESTLMAESNAMQGGFGWLNRWKQKGRREKFLGRIRHGKRTKEFKTVVAEGDSWFCFPVYVKDINQWLLEDDGINLYSIAAAGDWLTNIIYEGKYVEELSMIEPDVFLISGGGNDFCGSNRLSFMINTNVDEELKDDEFIKACISPAFDAFIWTMKTQYWLLLSSLKEAKKLKDLKVITQGYDYVIPCPKLRRGPDMVQWLINKNTATGDWLRTPLKLKGLHKIENQLAVMKHFINKVNELFIWLATYKEPGSTTYYFPNFYHIDCRGVAGGFDGWFDEIHLKSQRYKVVAEAYKHVIFGNKKGPLPFDEKTKVLKALWFDDKERRPGYTASK